MPFAAKGCFVQCGSCKRGIVLVGRLSRRFYYRWRGVFALIFDSVASKNLDDLHEVDSVAKRLGDGLAVRAEPVCRDLEMSRCRAVKFIREHLSVDWSSLAQMPRDDQLARPLDPEKCVNLPVNIAKILRDLSRIRKGAGLEISPVFRRLSLTVLQQDTSLKRCIQGERNVCGWDEAAFERLPDGFFRVLTLDCKADSAT